MSGSLKVTAHMSSEPLVVWCKTLYWPVSWWLWVSLVGYTCSQQQYLLTVGQRSSSTVYSVQLTISTLIFHLFYRSTLFLRNVVNLNLFTLPLLYWRASISSPLVAIVFFCSNVEKLSYRWGVASNENSDFSTPTAILDLHRILHVNFVISVQSLTNNLDLLIVIIYS